MATRVTFNLPDDTVAALKKQAEEREISVTEALRQAIENQQLLYEESRKGTKVLLDSPNAPLRQVIIR